MSFYLFFDNYTILQYNKYINKNYDNERRKTMKEFKRGNIFWGRLGTTIDPNNPHITVKDRPCVIISNDVTNEYSHNVTVLPLTTSFDDLPQHKKIWVNGKVSYTMPEDIRPLDKHNLYSFIEKVSSDTMKIIEEAIKIQLSLDDYAIHIPETDKLHLNKLKSIVTTYKELQSSNDIQGLIDLAGVLGVSSLVELRSVIDGYKKELFSNEESF